MMESLLMCTKQFSRPLAVDDEIDAFDVNHYPDDSTGNINWFVIRSKTKTAVFSFTATIKSPLMCTKQFWRPIA
jgi:hypothetical protein